MNMTSSQWHMIAAADDIIECNGRIVGVVIDSIETFFSGSMVNFDQAFLNATKVGFINQ